MPNPYRLPRTITNHHHPHPTLFLPLNHLPKLLLLLFPSPSHHQPPSPSPLSFPPLLKPILNDDGSGCFLTRSRIVSAHKTPPRYPCLTTAPYTTSPRPRRLARSGMLHLRCCCVLLLVVVVVERLGTRHCLCMMLLGVRRILAAGERASIVNFCRT